MRSIKGILFILLALALCLPLQARIRRQKKITREYYENGTLRKYTLVKTAQTIGFEQDDNYKRTKVVRKEYRADGTLATSFRKITKIGTSGRRCYEIIMESCSYDERGILRKKEIHECDDGKTTQKFYNEKGKLTFTKIVYEIR